MSFLPVFHCLFYTQRTTLFLPMLIKHSLFYLPINVLNCVYLLSLLNKDIKDLPQNIHHMK